ncbi:uncharacterized protein LOC144711327 isoform X2 [Wolffia australiana]
MSYVPPHKRQTVDFVKPSRPPESVQSQFRKKLNINPSSSKIEADGIVYARDFFRKWWPFSVKDDDPELGSWCLESASLAFLEHDIRSKPFVLARLNPSPVEGALEQARSNPWDSIADKLMPDLVSSLESLRTEIKSQDIVFSPALVTRVGKVIFMQVRSSFPETLKLPDFHRLQKVFHTSLPPLFLEEVSQEAIPKVGFLFSKEKTQYLIKIIDKLQNKIYMCKCVVAEDSDKLKLHKVCPYIFLKLKLHKVHSDLMRHMVQNVSCLDRDLDLRVMLTRKQNHTDIPDEVKEGLCRLVEAAIFDEGTKGGLKWQLGKETFNDRFVVVGSWDTRQRKYKIGSFLTLYLRRASRFDYVSDKGIVSHELTIKMNEAKRWLAEDSIDEDSISKTLREAIKITWENFLDCSHPLK